MVITAAFISSIASSKSIIIANNTDDIAIKERCFSEAAHKPHTRFKVKVPVCIPFLMRHEEFYYTQQP